MMIAALRQFGFCSALLLAACGGSSSEPETPADVEGDAPSEESSEGESEAAAEGEEGSEEATEEEAAPAEDSRSGVNPKDVLVREGTTFMINHRESDMGKKAEEKCAAQAGDDVAKKANCLSKAINNMKREGLMFDEEGGQWRIIRIVIAKGAKYEHNKYLIEVGEPSGNTITIKTVGKDESKLRTGRLPQEMKFEIPDEYTVILHHPDNGKMVYEPKMGMFDE